MNKDYEQKLNEEIESRIVEMENEEYDFPQKFSFKDYITMTIICAVCLGLIIMGAWV